MDDYNWPDLYRQADEFMRQYIPETMIIYRNNDYIQSAITVRWQTCSNRAFSGKRA